MGRALLSRLDRALNVALLLAAACVPLLWYRAPGFLISGDMLPPLAMENFFNRFFAWDERLGAGAEALLHYSAMAFYFVEALFTSIFPTLESAQKAEFILFYILPGLTFYYFLGVLLEGKGREWGRRAGVAFYLFNLYLEPVWQGMNVANLASYTFVPLMLGLFIEGLERRRPFWLCVFGLSLASFLAAPIGSNPPMLMASGVPFLVYFIFFLAREKPWRQRGRLREIVAFFFCVFLFSFLANLFWIIPFVDKVFVNVAGTSLEFTAGSALDWLKGLCQNTSLLNVARMQGAWVWYAGFGEPYIPYAAVYQQNLFWILLGYLLPVLALAGYFISRKHPWSAILLLLALLGIVLGAGVHKPFGKLYEALLKVIPFFYTIRSPWYKFTLLTCLAYGGLLALLGQFLAAKMEEARRKKGRWPAAIPAAALGLLILFQPVYAFPIATGKLFLKPDEREWMTHNFMKIPPYTWECLRTLRAKGEGFRLLDASTKKMQEYRWGNYGFNHLLTSYSRIPIFYGSMMNSPSLHPSDEIEKQIQKVFLEGSPEQLAPLLKQINVQYLIHPSDLYWYGMKEIEENAQIRRFLEEAPGLELEKNFGPWNLYRMTGKTPPVVEFFPKATSIEDEIFAEPAPKSGVLAQRREERLLANLEGGEAAAKSVQLLGDSGHFNSYFGEEGLILKWNRSVPRGNPTATLRVESLEPVSLDLFPDLEIDYAIYDPRSCEAQVRLGIRAGGETDSIELPAFPYMPLRSELHQRHPAWQNPELQWVEVQFSHSFEHRRGMRRYPDSDAVVTRLALKKRNPKTPSVTEDKTMKSTDVPFKKLSPVAYRATLPQKTKGMLVLNQGFHPRWIAKNSQGRPMPHRQVKGWANGYEVDLPSGGEVTLEFGNQKSVWFGFGLSSAVLLGLFLGWLKCLLKRKSK